MTLRRALFCRFAVAYSVLMVAKLLTSSVKGEGLDAHVCKKLRDHIENLKSHQARAAVRYLPSQDCPEKFRLKLNQLEASHSKENQNNFDAFIKELEEELRSFEDLRFIPCALFRFCSGGRDQFKVALTYARFSRAKQLFRAREIIHALYQILQLKLMRRKMRGVDMDEIYTFERELLLDLVNVCENDYFLVCGKLDQFTSDYDYFVNIKTSIYRFEPNKKWDSEEDTAAIIHEILDLIHKKFVH